MQRSSNLLVALLGATCIICLFANVEGRRNSKPHPSKLSCVPTDGSSLCRFNDDCCSQLCTTFKFDNVTCVENTPANHISDSFHPQPTIPDFKPTSFAGMERWKDKVAVITGAASGIGFALAKRLCNEGMIVVGTDLNEEGVIKTKDSCPQGRYYPFAADLRSEADIVGLFAYVDKTLQRVDVLVNNAGVTRYTSLLNISTEALQSTFAVNIIAPILCVRETMNIMQARNITSGYLMFTNSIHGSTIEELEQGSGAAPTIYIYEATKHALKVVREGIRNELRARNSTIRVGEVSPASVITNIPESHIPRDLPISEADEIKKTFAAEAGVNKLARLSPDDVAEAFVYMLSAPERMDINTILIQNNLPF